MADQKMQTPDREPPKGMTEQAKDKGSEIADKAKGGDIPDEAKDTAEKGKGFFEKAKDKLMGHH